MGAANELAGSVQVLQYVTTVLGWPVVLALVAGLVLGITVATPASLYVSRRRSRKRGLVTLRELAIVMLLNRYIGSDLNQQVKKLEADCAAWERAVVGVLQQLRVPHEQVSPFRTLGTWSGAPLPGATPEHAHIRSITAEKISRLERITGGVGLLRWRQQ
jgi:hypothetical protein